MTNAGLWVTAGGTGDVLVSTRGVPLPPQAVVDRLRQLSHRLSVRWVAGAWSPYWGLFEAWGPEDPRWDRVRVGELDPARAEDLVQMFPRDCAASDMAAFVESRWGDRNRLTAGQAASEAERIATRSLARQDAVLDAAVARVHQQGVEQFERETPHDRRVRAGVEDAHPMVPGGLTT